MSLWLGVIDALAGTLTHTNAGHPCPVVLHGAGHEQLDSHGMLLGVLREAAYGLSSVRLARDDVLVAFSDGVTEAMNSERRLFGTANVVRAARRAEGGSAAAILATVREALEQHIAGGVRPDDRTLVVLRGVSSC
jgi:phosphoserine phosphatase RsbU/P